jgi:hypothetical protein
VPAPSADVAVDGATGLPRERRQAALTALAPAHRHDSAHQIDVSHGEVEELTGAHAGFGHQPQDRLVAPIAKVGHAPIMGPPPACHIWQYEPITTARPPRSAPYVSLWSSTLALGACVLIASMPFSALAFVSYP